MKPYKMSDPEIQDALRDPLLIHLCDAHRLVATLLSRP